MSEQVDSETMDNHASVHDLEKLVRWQTALADASAPEEGVFPSYAIFLVSGGDCAAHNVFRRYRLVFEQLEAGFENLIILGQHGTSSTLLYFLSDLGLSWERVPILLLSSNPASADIMAIDLPKGSDDAVPNGIHPWNRALDLIADSTRGNSPSPLSDPGITKLMVPNGSLISTVENAIGSLQADHLNQSLIPPE